MLYNSQKKATEKKAPDFLFNKSCPFYFTALLVIKPMLCGGKVVDYFSLVVFFGDTCYKATRHSSFDFENRSYEQVCERGGERTSERLDELA